jgi:DDE superfamily endonuclease
VTVDGTDFRIREPKDFDSKWYTKKYNGPGLRYEVAVCIHTGHIVWCHGPFPCGQNPDITIFRKGLKDALEEGEMAEGDSGYIGEPLTLSSKYNFRSENHRRSKALARARHECINRLLKQFEVLHQRFHHGLEKHAMCFYAVAVITQLAIMFEEKKVWHVDYVEGETFNDPLIDLDV